MLDMIKLYGLRDNHWREMPADYDNRERLDQLIEWGQILKPTHDGQPRAAVLRASAADERFRIGCWRDCGSPKLLDWELKASDGQFALLLARCEMAVFLSPPAGVQLYDSAVNLLEPSVALDDPQYYNIPLYY